MRPLIMAFLVLAPFIAIAQNYHLPVLHSLPHAPVGNIAHSVVANAGVKMADMVHKVQELLS